MEVLEVVEVLVVVIVALLELEVAPVAVEELLLLDSVLLVVAEVCCPGVIVTTARAPATTNKAITITNAILEFERARVRDAIVGYTPPEAVKAPAMTATELSPRLVTSLEILSNERMKRRRLQL